MHVWRHVEEELLGGLEEDGQRPVFPVYGRTRIDERMLLNLVLCVCVRGTSRC